MDNLKLIYINEIGKNWEGYFIYEFLFHDDTESLANVSEDWGWDIYPADGNPEPPTKDYVIKVGRLSSELRLDVIQNSDTFAVWDSVDGVIALGWENLTEYDEYPEVRIHFLFGESFGSVTDKLYERDLILNYEENEVGSTEEQID